jgi:hypothetical protein
LASAARTQQHDRHFVVGQCELAGHRFGIETDHRH